MLCITEYKHPCTISTRRMRWAAHAARLGEMKNSYRILLWKPEKNKREYMWWWWWWWW